MAYGVQYSFVVTLMKGLVAGAGGGLVGALLTWIVDGVSTGDWSMKPETQGLLITAISAGAASLWVMLKNYLKQKWGLILPLLVCAVALQGCMTAGTGTPLAFGKPAKMSTEIKTQMPPEVDPVTGALIPGESYYAKIEKELPAGTDLEGQDNLHFGIGAGGDWDITLGQAAGYSSQGQAQGLLEFSKVNAQLQRDQQAQAWGSIMPFLSLLAPEAASLISKKMDLGAVDAARDDANKANRDAQILQFLEGLSKRLSKLEKPVKPADSPLVDVPVTLPEVGTN